MTQAALDLYDAQKKYQMESGVFSETVLLDGVTEVKGIFDEHYSTGNKDAGNVLQQVKKPRISLYEFPAGMIFGTSFFIIRGEKYIITKPGGTDKNGMQVLWLN